MVFESVSRTPFEVDKLTNRTRLQREGLECRSSRVVGKVKGTENGR